MKSWTPLVLLAALAFGGWKLWEWVRVDHAKKTAETRVAETLKALSGGDGQQALCLWAVGLGACDEVTQRRYTDEFDRWLRDTGIGEKPREFRVNGTEIERSGQAIAAFVLVTVDGRSYRLRVRGDEPLAIGGSSR